MTYKSQLIFWTCLASIALCAPQLASAARAKKSASPSPATSASPAASASAPAKERAVPFHGMISAVDAKAKTFTIAGKEKSRVFKISDRSIVTKAGNAATFKDIAEKEEVRGSYWKNADGTLEAKNVKLGPLTEEEKTAEEARKARRAEKKKEKAAAAGASTSPAASPAASAAPTP